jgi:hypothetical protein
MITAFFIFLLFATIVLVWFKTILMAAYLEDLEERIDGIENQSFIAGVGFGGGVSPSQFGIQSKQGRNISAAEMASGGRRDKGQLYPGSAAGFSAAGDAPTRAVGDLEAPQADQRLEVGADEKHADAGASEYR